MLIALPLLSALAVIPITANSYSSTEKRTLQTAISSVLQSAEINRYYKDCKEPAAEGQATAVLVDKEQARMLALLQQKVHTQNTAQLLTADPRLTQLVESSLAKPKDCTDGKALQALLDSYEVTLFSLEIAQPLERAVVIKPVSTVSRSNAAQNEIQQLIDRSHAIALVNVVDKQQLNAVQQANYLHPDYQGRYVFRVQHGWRSNVSQYLGMHIFVSDSDINSTAKQWLIFLDKNGHFIKTIAADKAPAYIKTLQQAEWRYDVHGNLHRN